MIQGRKGIQKILCFPRGKFFVEKYNDWIEFNDTFFAEIIEAYNSDVIKKPFVDKNHELKESYGELANPSIEDDGLYFEVTLNDSGVELIQSGLYTSISPTFGEMTDTSGSKWNNVLVSISLTNVPALQNNLPTLQEQFELETGMKIKFFSLTELKTEKENSMKNLEITRKLELTPEASEEAIAMAIQSLIDKGAEAEELLAAKESLVASLTAKIDELTGQVTQATEEVEMMKDEKEKLEFESHFNKSLEGGVILPAEKDYYFDLYKTKKELCLGLLKKFTGKASSVITLSNEGLTEEDYKIMIAQGLDKDNQKHLELYKKANGIK